MSQKCGEPAKGQRRLHPTRVPNLRYPVPSRRQRRVSVRRKVPKQHPEKLHVVDGVETLVFGHQIPVVVEEVRERRPTRVCVDVGEHVRRPILRAAPSRERLPKVLPFRLVDGGYVRRRVDEIRGFVCGLVEAAGAGADHEAHPVRFLSPPRLPHDGRRETHAVHDESRGDSPGSVATVQRRRVQLGPIRPDRYAGYGGFFQDDPAFCLKVAADGVQQQAGLDAGVEYVLGHDCWLDRTRVPRRGA